MDVTELVEESWKYSLKKLAISFDRKQQRNDIHHYFEFMFALERRFKDESLIKYGLKQISSKIIKTSNWTVFEAYLLKCGFGFPNTIQVIAHILATYRHHRYPLNLEAIGRLCQSLLRSSASSDHHGEVSWLLWISKELQLNVDDDVVAAVQLMGSPVCTLILLDMYHARIIKKPPDTTLLTPFATTEALEGPDWILSYEAGRREWLGIANDKFIAKHKYFGPLNDADVVFYDDSIVLPPIFEFKTIVADTQSFNFDTDKAIEQEFDFDDMDEEYFDSAELTDAEGDSEDDEGEGEDTNDEDADDYQ
jgi:hypothetical protein